MVEKIRSGDDRCPVNLNVEDRVTALRMHKDALIVYLIEFLQSKVCCFVLDTQRITLSNEKVFLFSALINKLWH